jgi:cytochrome c553
VIQNIFKKGVVLLTFAILFTGCSDKKDNTQEVKTNLSKDNVAVVSSSQKIEVIENSGAKEIKVQEKQKSNKANSYYLNYDKVKDKERDMVSTRTVVDAYTHIRSPYERVKISLIRQQLGKNFKLKCSACHDDYANGIVGPSLLGKDAKFIYNKIVEFKDTKKNPLMTELINQMSDDEIKQISQEIYEFNKRVQQLGARG